jgi:hypothetical protein
MRKRNNTGTTPEAAASARKEPVLTGRDAYIARLKNGETVSFRESGNSMTPRIKHRQKCTYAPVIKAGDIGVGDAVFCKVGPWYFTHLVAGIRGDQYQIANNHGHVNGWTTLDKIFGKVVALED